MTWDEVMTHIRSKYKVADQKGNITRLDFDIGDGRSQDMLIDYQQQPNGEEWIKFYSKIGQVPPSMLVGALREANTYISGGLVAFENDEVWARNCCLIAAFTPVVFDRTLEVTLFMAAHVKHEVLGI